MIHIFQSFIAELVLRAFHLNIDYKLKFECVLWCLSVWVCERCEVFSVDVVSPQFVSNGFPPFKLDVVFMCMCVFLCAGYISLFIEQFFDEAQMKKKINNATTARFKWKRSIPYGKYTIYTELLLIIFVFNINLFSLYGVCMFEASFKRTLAHTRTPSLFADPYLNVLKSRSKNSSCGCQET